MEIVTQRFLLRDFIPADEPAFSAYRADPRYAEFCAAAEVTSSFSHELLQLFSQWTAESPRRHYQLAVVDRLARCASAVARCDRRSPQLIGCAGLRREQNNSDWAELGIELAPQFWERYAYAIEIAAALIEFGFRDLDLQEIRGISVSANRWVNAVGSTLWIGGDLNATQPRLDARTRVALN
ncbi:GNAT family N-acetyltransferase [Leptolyngbya sp. NIES-2104]|uniref:GNAT family N-acetyltransferase n=1 Tax=Leptolyngbya sp. NIES-2104 TaxID=1552121 RepID=UPI0006EC7287|nr:GNAT family N-acetyltransferase [Leptolyngbya sp. NIES-2104]GAP96654.1 acetyltransferase [Leptolyngbya sp. NIES-2104]